MAIKKTVIKSQFEIGTWLTAPPARIRITNPNATANISRMAIDLKIKL